MKQLAYAMLLLVVLIVTPVAVEAEPQGTENAQGPCNWFGYTLSPPDVKVDLECLLSGLPP